MRKLTRSDVCQYEIHSGIMARCELNDGKICVKELNQECENEELEEE